MSCRSAFLFVASLLALFYLVNFGWVTRLPLGHDTLEYLQLQYAFLNEVVTRHEFAYWFPFMTMGTVSNWWFMISDGLLNNLYLLVSPLFAGGNYYVPFYLSLFFDELVLLAGAVCLARMLYSHGLTVLFVALSVVFSVNWVTQVWFGFHVFYLAPLMMFLFIDAWRNVRPLSAIAGCMCAVYAFYGNLPYTVPLFIWIVALPCGIRAIICLKPSFLRTGEGYHVRWPSEAASGALRRLVALAGGWRWLPYCVPLACVALIGFYLTQLGTRDIVMSETGRSADGSVSLRDFLSYGGTVCYQNIFEFVTGITFSNNLSLYLGGVAAALALFETWCVIAERRLSSASAIFIISAAIVWLLSSGNAVVGNAFYHLPWMSFYRHVGLSAVFAKLYLILAAGYGCDRLLSASVDPAVRRRLTWAAATVVAIKGLWGLMVLDVATGLDLLRHLVVNPFCNLSQDTLLMWLLPFLAVTVVPVLLLLLRSCKSVAWGRGAIIGLIALQFLDLIVFRVACLNGRMPANDVSAQRLRSCLAYEDYRYPPRRVVDARAAPRFGALGSVRWMSDAGLPYANFNDYGAVYWTTETFLLTDAARSLFRTDHRLKYLDRLASLRNHRIVAGTQWTGTQWITAPVERFPADSVYEKLIGVSDDKIQFFQTIRMTKSESEADHLLGNQQFSGDILVGLPEQRSKNKIEGPAIALVASYGGANMNDRVSATYTVDRFSFSSIDLSVRNPQGSPIALYYADTYHPYWRALVDGRQTPIIQANHAFKAIIVPSGTSRVSFVYGPPKLRIMVLALVVIGLSGVMLATYFIVLLLRGDIDRLSQNGGATVSPSPLTGPTNRPF